MAKLRESLGRDGKIDAGLPYEEMRELCRKVQLKPRLASEMTASSSLPSYGTEYASSSLGHTSLNERSRLQNSDRSHDKKLRWAEIRARDEQIEKEKQEKKRQDEESRKEQAAAALATPFQPSASAMLDPKAYFAQWQQHQKQCISAAEQISKSGTLKGQGRGKGSAGHGSLGARAAIQQAPSKPGNAVTPKAGVASLAPADVLSTKKRPHSAIATGPVTGMGLLGAYADSDDE